MGELHQWPPRTGAAVEIKFPFTHAPDYRQVPSAPSERRSPRSLNPSLSSSLPRPSIPGCFSSLKPPRLGHEATRTLLSAPRLRSSTLSPRSHGSPSPIHPTALSPILTPNPHLPLPRPSPPPGLALTDQPPHLLLAQVQTQTGPGAGWRPVRRPGAERGAGPSGGGQQQQQEERRQEAEEMAARAPPARLRSRLPRSREGPASPPPPPPAALRAPAPRHHLRGEGGGPADPSSHAAAATPRPAAHGCASRPAHARHAPPRPSGAPPPPQGRPGPAPQPSAVGGVETSANRRLKRRAVPLNSEASAPGESS